MKSKRVELDEHCSLFFNSWLLLRNERKYKEGKDLCNLFITELKKKYNEKHLRNESEYTYAYVFLILAKALQDVIELVPLTKEKYWPEDGKKTEAIWCKLWDAKERFSYFKKHWLGDDIVGMITAKLDELESYFYDTFGKGLYFSPDIIIKEAFCNVCGQNIKACMHLPGNIYAGTVCKEEVSDMKFESISIVMSPYDMRCRLWAWNLKEDLTVTGMFMSLNTVDGFIKKIDLI